MKKTVSFLLIFTLLFVSACFTACAVQLGFEVESANEAVLSESACERTSVSVMDGWKFKYKASDGEKTSTDDSSWQSVNLPHTWNISDGADGGNNYAKGEGWYRKQLTIPAEYEGTDIYLEFEGVNQKATLYIDGVLVPYVYEDGTESDSHNGGYTTFRYNITDLVTPGSTHLLAVCADNTIDEEITPIAGDWTFFGGIYREVWLVSVPKVHFDMLNYGSDSVFVTATKTSDNEVTGVWNVEVKTVLVNNTDLDASVSVNTVLREPEEFVVSEYIPEEITPFDEDTMYGTEIINSVSENITVPANSKVTYTKNFTVTNPRLWNGIEDPYRYQVDVSVTNGSSTDKVSAYTGFRTFYIDADEGFFLNGNYVALRGVSRHQDRDEMGWAISEKEHGEDFGMIYEMGANSIRLAHYPHDDFFYELCDRYGMVIWAEVPFITDIGGDGDYENMDSIREAYVQNIKEQLIELIRTQYNRPSIMFWGLQNEVRPDYNEFMSKLVPALHDLAKSEDPNRLTTFASYHDTAYSWDADLFAWNFYPAWYGYSTGEFTSYLKNYHNKYPDIPMGISEYGAGGSVKTHTDADPIKDAQPDPFGDHVHPEEYQTYVHKELARQLISEDLKFLWATYVWNMFDFASDSRNEGDRNGINDKGLVTYDREIKKDSFYVYKAIWSDDPFVHIEESRFVTRELEAIPVRITSNCENVYITVNGEKYGETLTNDGAGQFTFENVPLNIGENTVEVVGTAADGKTYTESVTWTRAISDNTVISSYSLNVDNDKKTIVLRSSVNADAIASHISSRYNATFTVLAKDGETVVTSGVIEPRMYLRVTAEDGENYADYMFLANNIAFGKTVTFKGNPVANLTNGISAEGHWTNITLLPSTDFSETFLDVDLGETYHINHVVIHVPYNVYGYKIFVSDDGISYKQVCDMSTANKGGTVNCPVGDVMGRFVRVAYVNGQYAATCTEIEVHGWKFSSEVYEIDELNKIITTNTGSETVDTQTFLLNCAIDGNCTYTINSGAYYISDGDELTVSGQEGGISKYTVCTGDDCTNSHASDVALNRPIITDTAGQAGFPKENLNDGDITTRWQSPSGYPVHVTIDLERYCDIEYFDITMFAYEYGNNRAYQYEILVSTDNEEWIQVVDNTANYDYDGLYTHYLKNPVTARYIKVNFTGCKAASGAQGTAGIYNFSAYGTVYDGKPTGITAKNTEVYLGIGDVERIRPVILPEFATLPTDISFESSDTAVATVDEKGIVTAVKAGSCTITLSSESAGLSCEIKVVVDTKKILSRNRTIHSASDSTGQSAGHLPAKAIDGLTQRIDGVDSRWQCGTATYPQWLIIDLERVCLVDSVLVDMFGSQYPGNRYYGYQLYAGETVDDMALVVDQSGNTNRTGYYTHTLSTPVKARYIKISVTGCSNAGSSAGVNEITVYGTELNQEIQDLNFAYDSIDAVIGEDLSLEYSVYPSLADRSVLSWHSSDENVATVENGVVTGISTGTATITAYDSYGTALDEIIVMVANNKLLSLGKPVSHYDDFGVKYEHGTGFINTVDKLTNGARPADNASNFNFERWHFNDRNTHYAVIDLEQLYEIDEFKTYFFYWNARAYGYRISVSCDGNIFVPVFDKLANTAAGIKKDTLTQSVIARFIKLEVTAPTAGASATSTTGVYEFEVYGREITEDYSPETIYGADMRIDVNPGIRLKAAVMPSYRSIDSAVEYGFIVTRKDILENNDLTETDLYFGMPDNIPYTYGAAFVKDSEGNVQKDIINYEGEDGSIVFSAVLTGIAKEHYQTELTIRPYLKTTTSSGFSVTYYGDVQSASVYSTAKAIKAAGYIGLNDSQIEKINYIISAVEN